ncbi:MAG: hypothetical protein AAGA93_20735 [Actinomycetota bacterium]
MNLLAEGFESALMACSLIVILPGLATAMAARRDVIPALAAYGVAISVLSWVRFSDRGGGFTPLLIALALGLAVVALVVPRLAGRPPSPTGDRVGAMIGGVLAGGAAAELWRPCVGLEFGRVLNELPDRGATGLGQMVVYLLGVLSPLVAAGAVHQLLPEGMRQRAEPWLVGIGGTALALLALATAAGLHDELVGQLFEWSIEG